MEGEKITLLGLLSAVAGEWCDPHGVWSASWYPDLRSGYVWLTRGGSTLGFAVSAGEFFREGIVLRDGAFEFCGGPQLDAKRVQVIARLIAGKMIDAGVRA